MIRITRSPPNYRSKLDRPAFSSRARFRATERSTRREHAGLRTPTFASSRATRRTHCEERAPRGGRSQRFVRLRRARDRRRSVGLRRVADRDRRRADRVAALAWRWRRRSAITKRRDAASRRSNPAAARTRPRSRSPFAMSFRRPREAAVAAEARFREIKGLPRRARLRVWREDNCSFRARVPTSRSGSPKSRGHRRGSGGERRAADPHVSRRPAYQNAGGWEILTRLDLIGNAERTAEDAVALLSANSVLRRDPT